MCTLQFLSTVQYCPRGAAMNPPRHQRTSLHFTPPHPIPFADISKGPCRFVSTCGMQSSASRRTSSHVGASASPRAHSSTSYRPPLPPHFQARQFSDRTLPALLTHTDMSYNASRIGQVTTHNTLVTSLQITMPLELSAADVYLRMRAKLLLRSVYRTINTRYRCNDIRVL